jgi:tellurite methyltransferase
MNHSVDFFDRQFQAQLRSQNLELNPFERVALAHCRGRVLDFGCGLGNLAVSAARTGLCVDAVDASPAAIGHLAQLAQDVRLRLKPVCADAEAFEWQGCYDTVVSIGLLMFLDCASAWRLMQRLTEHTCPGGTAVVNVLVSGTTYLDMFGSDAHCLFDEDELPRWFDAHGWSVVQAEPSSFDAPGGTVKRFTTVVAQRPM